MGCGSSSSASDPISAPAAAATSKLVPRCVLPALPASVDTTKNSGEVAGAIRAETEYVKSIQDMGCPIWFALEHLEEIEDEAFDSKNYEEMLTLPSIERIFAKCDLDGDQLVTGTELKTALDSDQELVQIMAQTGLPVHFILKHLEEEVEEGVSIEQFRSMLHDPSIEGLFARCDINNDGAVTCAELREVLKADSTLAAMMQEAGKPIQYIVEYLEEAGEDGVTIEQFRSMLHDPSVEALFARCDLNNDGQVSAMELKEALDKDPELVTMMKDAGKPIEYILTYFGTEATEDDVTVDIDTFRDMLHTPSLESLFAKCDIDSDGNLTKNELNNALKNEPVLVQMMKEAHVPVDEILASLESEGKESISLEKFRELAHSHENGESVTAPAEAEEGTATPAEGDAAATPVEGEASASGDAA